VNWLIAEHKSQGAMQLGMNEGDKEVFWFFAVNNPARADAVGALFKKLAE
jgi:N-acetylglucosamine malate deacetylase 2